MRTPDDIFHDAREIADPAARDVFLDEACNGDEGLRSKVDQLLRADAELGGFLASKAGGPTTLDPVPLSERPGSRIGPYKLLQVIGEGGFGTVFLAEQTEPVRRKVAVKIIKLGMDSRQVIARFEAERQALAVMNHPHIARVFDGGVTDSGRPYFVMEYVVGEAITQFSDTSTLSVAERLDLFRQVCAAVQHAHTKGIIHRDLKPANVLVSMVDGKPYAKVIDFGIAKATASPLTDKTLFTEHRQLIGTPEYMSPEQAEGSPDIDTRTDVYALGVLLYELLTGLTPLDGKRLRSAAYGEMQRIIKEEEPLAPSLRLTRSPEILAATAAHRRTEPDRLGPQVRGELDWIVMKALDKDRGRRYESAAQLATDIGNHLAGVAVVAAPPSRGYRVRKFVRRNKGTVIGGSAVSAALLLGLAGTAWGWNAASQSNKELTENLDIARESLLSSIVQTVDLDEDERLALIAQTGFSESQARREQAEAYVEGLRHARKFLADEEGRPVTASELNDIALLSFVSSMSVKEIVELRDMLQQQAEIAQDAMDRISEIVGCDDCDQEDSKVIGDVFLSAWKQTEEAQPYLDAPEEELRLRALGAFGVQQSLQLRSAIYEARWSAYTANLALAQMAIDAGNYPEARLRLANCPETNRGWEWNYLDRFSRSIDLSLGTFTAEQFTSDLPAIPLGEGRVLITTNQLPVLNVTEGVQIGSMMHNLPDPLQLWGSGWYVSPDGKHAAHFFEGGDGTWASTPMRCFHLESDQWIEADYGAGFASERKPVWSADGSRIATKAGKLIRVRNTGSGQITAEFSDVTTKHISLSADGSLAAYFNGESITVCHTDGGDSVAELKLEYPWNDAWPGVSPVFGPSGTELLVPGQRLSRYDASTGELIRLYDIPTRHVSWVDSDHVLVRPDYSPEDALIVDLVNGSAIRFPMNDGKYRDTEWGGVAYSSLDSVITPITAWNDDNEQRIGVRSFPISEAGLPVRILRPWNDPVNLHIEHLLGRDSSTETIKEVLTQDKKRRILAQGSTLRFIDSMTEREVAVFQMDTDIHSVSLTSDGTRLIILLADDTARVWDTRNPSERRNDYATEWSERGPASTYLDSLWDSDIPTDDLKKTIVSDQSQSPLRRIVACDLLELRVRESRHSANIAFEILSNGQTDKVAVQASAADYEAHPRVRELIIHHAAAWEYKAPKPNADELLASETKRRRLAEANAAIWSVQARSNTSEVEIRDAVLDAIRTYRELDVKHNEVDYWAILDALSSVALRERRFMWAESALRAGEPSYALNLILEAPLNRQGGGQFNGDDMTRDYDDQVNPKNLIQSAWAQANPCELAVLAMIRINISKTDQEWFDAACRVDQKLLGATLSREQNRLVALDTFEKAKTLMANPASVNEAGVPWSQDRDSLELLAEVEKLIKSDSLESK